MTDYRMSVPLFGEMVLRPRRMDEKPVALLGYVEFDRPGHLTVAINVKGEWRDRKRRPFPAQPARWYSMEKPDGSPFF